MKYKENHPSQHIAIALGLEKKTTLRLLSAIQKAYKEANAINFDGFIGFVAPYIKTPEEAFFVAITMASQVDAAFSEVEKTTTSKN